METLRNVIRYSLLVCAAVVASGAVENGFAQGEDGDDETQTIEEVIVTATRRGEASIQEIPLAVSAFSGEELKSIGIVNVEALTEITPSFTYSANGPWAISSIRGVGTNNVFAGGDPSVTVQVDGVYYARTANNNIDFLDVERVEVLRGPQGTLYGRNAVAGTINVVTKDPTNDFNSTARLSIGNYDTYRGEAFVSGPIAENRVYGSIAAQVSNRDGYIEQLSPGVADPWSQDRWAVRGKLKFEPNDNFDLTLAGDYAEQNEDLNFDWVRIRMPFDDGYTPGHFQAAHTIDTPIDAEQSGLSATAVWRVSDTLTWTSITAYRESDFLASADLDNNALFITHTNYLPEDQDQFSQEILANVELAKLSLVGGFFYFEEDVSSFINNEFNLFSVYQHNGITNDTKSYAFFAEGKYALTDVLSLTVGLRYTKDEKDGVNSAGLDFVNPDFGHIPAYPENPSTLPVTTTIGPTVELDFEAWTPKFVLDYQAKEDLFLYVSATRGFKSGGFNLLTDTLNLPTVTPVPYDEEDVWAYEAGLRSTVAGGRATLNLTAFYYDYEGLQVNQFSSTGAFGQAVINAPGAKISGLEFESNADISDNFTLGGNLAYLSAEYDGFFLVPDDPNPVPGTYVDADGNDTNDAPEWSGNVYADLHGALGDRFSGAIRLDVSYKDSVFYTPSNNPLESGDSYWLLNLSASMTTRDGRWTFGVQGRNLTEEEYITRATSLIGITGGRPGAPRTVLAYIEVNF